MVTDKFKGIMDRFHEADKLTLVTASPGGQNEGISARRKGLYVSMRRGLVSDTYFIGYNPESGEPIAELVA